MKQDSGVENTFVPNTSILNNKLYQKLALVFLTIGIIGQAVEAGQCSKEFELYQELTDFHESYGKVFIIMWRFPH